MTYRTKGIKKIGKRSYSVTPTKIKSKDPLAYAYGYIQAREGRKMPKDKDLAPEFKRGFKEGKIKKKKKYDQIKDINKSVYGMGADVTERSNPFFMAGRSLGYSKDKQKQIQKRKFKVSSSHLKMMGQKDIKINDKKNIRSKKTKKKTA
jgi:hypothetical protein